MKINDYGFLVVPIESGGKKVRAGKCAHVYGELLVDYDEVDRFPIFTSPLDAQLWVNDKESCGCDEKYRVCKVRIIEA